MALSLAEHFCSLKEPRIELDKHHALIDIIALTVCAVVSDADGWEFVGGGALREQLAARGLVRQQADMLIASGFWALLARFEFGRSFGAGAGNITQTTASSSANIISGGLVAPIPALAMLSGSNLTFTLDPSLMLAGFGAIIGFRAGISLLLGGIVSWGLLGPWGLSQGFVAPGENDLDAS